MLVAVDRSDTPTKSHPQHHHPSRDAVAVGGGVREHREFGDVGDWARGLCRR